MHSLAIFIFLYACESWPLTAELEKRTQAFEMQSYRAQCKDKEQKEDRRRVGKTILKNRQEWTLPAQLEQLKTGQGGKGLLQIHLRCPDNLPRLWDKTK